MRIRNIVLFVYMICVIVPAYAENMYSEEIWDALNYRRKLDRGDWLPFKMALPEHYVVLPIDRSKELGLDPGFCCGERSTIRDLWKQYEKDPNAALYPLSGFFYISWSWDIAQRESNTFSASDQEIRSMLEKQGATAVKITSLFWNEFPVKSLEAEFPFSSRVFIAWIGLNTGGEVLKIQYFCPPNKPSFIEECAIWNQFLHNSTGMSYDEYWNRVKEEMESIFKN